MFLDLAVYELCRWQTKQQKGLNDVHNVHENWNYIHSILNSLRQFS